MSFDDRTSATTIHWDFRTNQGMPFIGIQGAGKTAILVGQADINGTKIDVKMVVDASTGKFDNSNGQWAQVNNPTYFTMPICNGAHFLTYTMNKEAKGTFDGVEAGVNNGYNLEYDYTGDANTMTVGLGAASWYQYIEVTYPSMSKLSVTIGDTGYATYYNNEAVEIPAGLKAYWGKLSSDQTKVELTEISDGIIPANTAVVVAGAANTYALTATSEAGSAYASNVLKGVVANTAVSALELGAGNVYVLAKAASTGKAAFCKYNAATLGDHRAFLFVAAGGAPELSIVFAGEDVTGVEAIETAQQTDGTVFNLQGQRVAQQGKGLYIVGGKKVIVK